MDSLQIGSAPQARAVKKIISEGLRGEVFFNSKDINLSSAGVQQLIQKLQKQALARHIWVATSGTASKSGPRFVALSEEAFFASAQAVNDHIQADAQDRWLNVLPLFHVGSLSIYFRAELKKQEVVDISHVRWNVQDFENALRDYKITLTSLVPTQIFDLVKNNIRCTPQLRLVFVGGGALSAELYKKARALGWPLVRTYGMTETASQVATEPISHLDSSSPSTNQEYSNFPSQVSLQILPHVQVRVTSPEDSSWPDEQLLQIQSSALFTTYAYCDTRQMNKIVFEDPKKEGWFTTEDFVKVSHDHRTLTFLGRRSDSVKILGEIVYLPQVEALLHGFGLHEVAVVAIPHERQGHELVAFFQDQRPVYVERRVAEANQRLPAYSKINKFFLIDEWPMTETGKIIKSSLVKMFLNDQA